MSIALKLKAHLIVNKITQKDAAKKIKMHYTRLNQYLNGFLNMTDDQIKQICKGLKLDYESYKKGIITEVKK